MRCRPVGVLSGPYSPFTCDGAPLGAPVAFEPVGSVLDVTNPHSGKTVRVRVAGRGPYNGRRILDLSTGAFSSLYGGLGRGVGPVRYTVVSRGGGSRERSGERKSSGSRRYRHHRRHRSH